MTTGEYHLAIGTNTKMVFIKLPINLRYNGHSLPQMLWIHYKEVHQCFACFYPLGSNYLLQSDWPCHWIHYIGGDLSWLKLTTSAWLELIRIKCFVFGICMYPGARENGTVQITTLFLLHKAYFVSTWIPVVLIWFQYNLLSENSLQFFRGKVIRSSPGIHIRTSLNAVFEGAKKRSAPADRVIYRPSCNRLVAMCDVFRFGWVL
jgi:hypothetical protein